jgi:HTH-type transcriptional regulator/antitoxin HigA
MAEIERLWGAAEGTPEGDRLDVLVTLVEAYEASRWSIPAADPVEVLRYAIDEMGRSQGELTEILGSRSRASEILSRKRALTLDMVRKIVAAWNIPADLLIRRYELEKVA